MQRLLPSSPQKQAALPASQAPVNSRLRFLTFYIAYEFEHIGHNKTISAFPRLRQPKPFIAHSIPGKRGTVMLYFLQRCHLPPILFYPLSLLKALCFQVVSGALYSSLRDFSLFSLARRKKGYFSAGRFIRNLHINAVHSPFQASAAIFSKSTSPNVSERASTTPSEQLVMLS